VTISALEDLMPARLARAGRRSRLRLLIVMITLQPLFGVTGCTGSPATLALDPSFEIQTPIGLAGVSIREALPGTTAEAFAKMVRTGMEQGASVAAIDPTAAAPSPMPCMRIVWHVNPVAARGVSRLVVNLFNGATSFAYEQVVVANTAPPAAITYTIGMTIRQLFARAERQGDLSGLAPTSSNMPMTARCLCVLHDVKRNRSAFGESGETGIG
jgi:hypothetical protein